MNTLFTFVLSAFAFAAATTAQTTTLTPGSNVKLAFSSDQTLCLGALSTEIGAQVVVGKCSTLPFSTFEVLEGSSTSSALGYKFPLVGSAGPVLCLSARGATSSVPLKFDVCQDDGLQLFEYSQPDDELFELFATGTCVTKSGTSATAKPCSAPSINVDQQWVPLAA